jgi:signal transduction histidine kinase
VALAAVAVLALWVLALLVGVNLVLAVRLRGQAVAVIRTRAEAAAATVSVRPDGRVRVRDIVDDDAIDVGTWIFQGRTVVERPSGRGSLDLQALQMVGVGRRLRRTGGPGGVQWYAVPVRHGGRQAATVVASMSLVPYRTTEESALAATVVLSLLLLGGAYLAFRAGIGRALRPVESMTHQAARWSTGDVDRRFGAYPRPAELDDLATTLDGLLDRLSAVLRHEKQLSAEISHELRTPLARILAETDLLRDETHPGAAVGDALVAIRASAVEMDAILETLMTAARQQGGAASGCCDVADVVRGLVARRQQEHPVIGVRGPASVPAGVDAALLERALSPVLDNALRFAAARVDVRLSVAPGLVRIDVRDDGPGIDPRDLPHVFDPGYRGAGAEQHPGAGLGLALSRRLIDAVHGTISAMPSERGALVLVTVPPA